MGERDKEGWRDIAEHFFPGPVTFFWISRISLGEHFFYPSPPEGERAG
jgi:hypothetical protein